MEKQTLGAVSRNGNRSFFSTGFPHTASTNYLSLLPLFPFPTCAWACPWARLCFWAPRIHKSEGLKGHQGPKGRQDRDIRLQKFLVSFVFALTSLLSLRSFKSLSFFFCKSPEAEPRPRARARWNGQRKNGKDNSAIF